MIGDVDTSGWPGWAVQMYAQIQVLGSQMVTLGTQMGDVRAGVASVASTVAEHSSEIAGLRASLDDHLADHEATADEAEEAERGRRRLFESIAIPMLLAIVIPLEIALFTLVLPAVLGR